MREFTSIVLSGGAFKAASMIGVIKYLEEHKLIKNLLTFVGTSAGATICFLLAMGFSSQEIRNFLLNIIHDDSLNDFDISEICSLLETYGIDPGDKLKCIFQRALFIKTAKSDMTFMEFAKVFGKNLVVCVSNLSKEDYEYFSLDTKPHMSVIDALKISCSVPLVFSPVILDNYFYVDGGLYNNFPISYFDKQIFKDVIGVNIKTNNYQKTDNFLNYFRFLIYSVIERVNSNSNSSICNDLKKNIITLQFNDDEDLNVIKDFKLDVSEDIVDKYIKIGYEAIESLAKETKSTEL